MSEITTITIEDYYKFSYLQDVAVSPNGQKIAFITSTYEDKEGIGNKKSAENKSEILGLTKDEKKNIWIYDINTQKSRQLTFGTMHINVTFSPDGKFIAFNSVREGNVPQLYLLSLEGGEARKLTTLPQGVGTPAIWSPDGKFLAFSVTKNVPPKMPLPYRFTREFYRMDGMGNVDHTIHEIYTLEIETLELKQRTNDNSNNINPKWSPDGSKIMYSSNFDPKKLDGTSTILKILDGNNILSVNNEWYKVALAEWITNDQIVFAGEILPFNKIILGSKTDLFVYNLQTQELDNRTKNFYLGVGGGLQPDMPALIVMLNKLLFSDDKKFAYGNVHKGGCVHIYRIALSGEISCEPIVEGERFNSLMGLTSTSLIFISGNHNNPLDLFSTDLEGKNEYQITSLNKKFLETKALPSVEHLLFLGTDGVQVEGWLLIPPEGQIPYPTALNIHGGPHSAWGNIFNFDNQMLCGAGYAILMINQRASTGYGDDFSTAIIGDWGNLDFKDIMAGVDKAIELGFADSDKLGVFGISGGGYLSSWIISNTNRFKAAVPENPVTNWQSFYGVSDCGRVFALKELGGLPHEIPEIYFKCSPVNHAHKCTTPTLLIQHENDLRCPAEQSEQIYAILRDAGCIVEMLRMPGTSHIGSVAGPLATRETQNRAILAWFDKYILGK